MIKCCFWDEETHVISVSFLTSLYFYYIPDVMKSEERQKLAKERREEKAKYFGKCWRRAPPSGRAEAGGAAFPL